MARIRVGGVLFEVPELDHFSMGELADMERYAGGPLAELSPRSFLRSASVAFVALRRAGVVHTREEFDALRDDEIEWLEEEPPVVPPTGPAAADAATGSEQPTADETYGIP